MNSKRAALPSWPGISRTGRRLLENADFRASTALTCSFASEALFSNVFARQMGIPPSVWRDYRH